MRFSVKKNCLIQTVDCIRRFGACVFSFCVMVSVPGALKADVVSLDDALRATYSACVGIDDELAELKKMAGINTAVSGVGVAAGAGATVTGIIKSGKDEKAAALEEILKEIKELQKDATQMTEQQVTDFVSEFNAVYDVAITNVADVETELEKTKKQSKSLGNWRTGLIATGAVANVAGAVIAGGNKVDGDVKASIDACKASIVTLRSAIMQSRLNGVDVGEAQNIADVCGEYEWADLSKINTKAKGAAISSGVGAATGIAGTIVSASANSKGVRNGDDKKEKGLNLAANVLSGATTVASASATVFNATQIKAIKQVAEIAQNCTGVLR